MSEVKPRPQIGDKHINQVKRERDDILVALKALEKRSSYMAHCCGFFQDDVEELVNARAVIAKLEPK